MYIGEYYLPSKDPVGQELGPYEVTADSWSEFPQKILDIAKKTDFLMTVIGEQNGETFEIKLKAEDGDIFTRGQSDKRKLTKTPDGFRFSELSKPNLPTDDRPLSERISIALHDYFEKRPDAAKGKQWRLDQEMN